MFRIAVIEDDIIMRKLLQRILAAEGFECVLSGSAALGRHACAREKPDLAILDINLPDENGIELCRKFKTDERLRHIPILLLTGEVLDTQSRLEGLEAGAEDFMLKPFSPRELVSRIRGIVRTCARPTLA